jgi:SAM-dependent methyltransferase
MDVPGNWWESFFNGVAVDLWLKAMPASLTEQEADLIVHALQPQAGAELLDVPCGCGRLAQALALRGYRVTGVDLSEESLGHARRAAHTVSWERRDMRDLPWPARFDGAYCVGNSFGYLDDEGNETFLRSVAATLKPGGMFVLETPMVAESAWLTVKDRAWWKVDDIHLLVANRFDHTRGRLDTEYTFISDGRVEVRHGTHRVYTYRQLVDLLNLAGFSDVTGWTRPGGHPAGAQSDGGPPLEPYRMGAPMLLLIARREVRHARD